MMERLCLAASCCAYLRLMSLSKILSANMPFTILETIFGMSTSICTAALAGGPRYGQRPVGEEDPVRKAQVHHPAGDIRGGDLHEVLAAVADDPVNQPGTHEGAVNLGEKLVGEFQVEHLAQAHPGVE